MSKKHVVIPIFVPHKGCPHDCIFCNQKKISGQLDEMSIDKMRLILETNLETIDPESDIEIGFYGGSFTGIDKEMQIEFLKTASQYIKNGKVGQIRLSTRPDYITEEILEYLKFYNVGTIELGVQSLDEDVLKTSCRGHSAEDVFRSARLIKKSGFKLGLQTMVGLPKDSREKDLETARKVIEMSPEIVRIYPVLVIKGTYLEKMLQDGSYNPPTLEEAVETCADLLKIYENNNINVIRIGLQPSENISEGSEIAGGPFHPAFRQLVEARLALGSMEECIISQGLEGKRGIIIQTGIGNISNVVGQKKSNINYIREKYSIKDIKVEGNGKYHKEIYIQAVPLHLKP
jgi:histone acetyltransferase (RNA polymerase elongator complex component)